MLKLFTKVKCHAYYKKAHDGISLFMTKIVGYDSDGTPCEVPTNEKTFDASIVKVYGGKTIDGEGRSVKWETLADLSECCGDSVEKTYYDMVSDEFTGVIVGYKNIAITGYIGTDSVDDEYYGHYGYCFKQPKDVVKVARVFFKNNCSRLVPLDAMVEIKENEELSKREINP